MRRFALGLALIVAVAGLAGAAELPTLRAKPADHQKTCMIDGMRGFLIPNSDTCVKLGGYVSGGFHVGGSRPQAGGPDALGE